MPHAAASTTGAGDVEGVRVDDDPWGVRPAPSAAAAPGRTTTLLPSACGPGWVTRPTYPPAVSRPRARAITSGDVRIIVVPPVPDGHGPSGKGLSALWATSRIFVTSIQEVRSCQTVALVLGTLFGSLIDLNKPGNYVHWGFIQMSYGNLMVIVLMVIVFFAAILIPFKSHKGGER